MKIISLKKEWENDAETRYTLSDIVAELNFPIPS
jgi:hypothetical protein